MTDSTTPAFPAKIQGPHLGLTKREYITALMMQGMLANSACEFDPNIRAARAAVEFADTLIQALEE